MERIKYTPQIRQLKFDPVHHRYTDEDDLVYTSVTTKIDLFAPKFDELFWAKKKALERGISVQAVLDEWARIRDYACDKGNIVHGKLETSVDKSAGIINVNHTEFKVKGLFKGENPVWGYEIDISVLAETPLAICYPTIFTTIRKYVERGWKIYSEKRVYLYEYLIAGTIDLLLVKDNEFIIIDWKTNKDKILHFTSGYYKKVNGIKTDTYISKEEWMLAPINYLPHCKGIKYSLQLSMYAYLCEAWGYKCKGLILFHIREKSIESAKVEDKKSDAVINPYAIQYLNTSIEKMVNYKSVPNVKKQVSFLIK